MKSANETGSEMTRRAVSVRPDESLPHAWTIMHRCGFHHLPVLDKGVLVGMLSDRDILRTGVLSDRDLVIKPIFVSEAMTKGVYTCRAKDRIGDVANEMLTRKIDALPVVDEIGRVTGIITSTDLLRHLRRFSGVVEGGAVTEELIDMVEGGRFSLEQMD